jgi:6-phosphogluconolactonase/glucosamine-6-phosphate isomerase/deaminase
MLHTEQPSEGFHGMTGAGRYVTGSHSVDHKVTQLTQQLLKSAFSNFSERERRVIIPLFDMVLMGLGADGHTASLFLGHAEHDRWPWLCAATHIVLA